MLHETTETSLRALCEEPNIMYQQISSTLQSDRRDHNVALTLYLFSESILTFLQYSTYMNANGLEQNVVLSQLKAGGKPE